MTDRTPDAFRLQDGTILRRGFGGRWETLDGAVIHRTVDQIEAALSSATPLWLGEEAS